MPVLEFPDPRDANEDGIVAIGGDLHPVTLLTAYRAGIFPWPIEGLPLTWFSPDPRAILDFKKLHIPRSLKKAANQSTFRFTLNQAFEDVIHECAKAPRGDRFTQPDSPLKTWITPELLQAYLEFHRMGHAHSVEVWENDDLVGGIYGVAVDGTFAGESMFYKKPNASKLALLHLINHLQSKGLTWMDIQMLTPHMEALGAEEISREAFIKKLKKTQKEKLRLF